MGKGTIKTKAMTMAVAMSMVAGLCPSTVFAANSEVVAKVQDGTHIQGLQSVHRMEMESLQNIIYLYQ